MATKAQVEAISLYAGIMEEIKIRVAAIDSGTTNQTGLAPPLVKEFCFLQIRMICELIALGCLVAHGDIGQSKKLMKEWAADKIISALESLHPDFFPQACGQSRTPEGHHNLTRIERGITKTELISLYGNCGNILHRGSVKKLLTERMPIQVHYPEITQKAQKIVDLLSIHVVTMLGGEMFFVCTLRNANDNFRVQVAIAEASAFPPPSV
jgi:hypothetical protein